MKAIEFEAPTRNGVIPIPPQLYHEGFPAFVRVIVLSKTEEETSRAKPNAATLARRKAAFDRLDGCLAGMTMTLDEIKDARLARQ